MEKNVILSSYDPLYVCAITFTSRTDWTLEQVNIFCCIGHGDFTLGFVGPLYTYMDIFENGNFL